MRWVVFVILGGVLLIAVYVAGFFPSFGNGCSVVVIKEVASPDGLHTAAVIEQRCQAGAQTHATRAVALYETGDGFDDDFFDVTYIATSTSPIQLVWQTNNRLLIDPQGTDMYSQKNHRWNEIEILYEP